MKSLGRFVLFVQVAETRSFVGAGRLLGISASAVGKSISRLEDKLGVRLFHRSTRSVTLTAEGVMFLERSKRILAEIEAAEQELVSVAGAPRGKLRVSLPLVSALVLPVLADFMREYPNVELDLDFTDRQVDVIEEGFDAVVRVGEPKDSRLSARTLGDFRRLLVGSPDYFAQRGVPLRPADLASHACLHYRYPSSGKIEQWALRRARDGADGADAPEIALPTAMICNNIETRLCFALQGLGIAYLPDFAVREPLASGKLVSVLDEYVDAGGTFRILWPASRHPSPKLRAFIDFLAARVFAPHRQDGARDR